MKTGLSFLLIAAAVPFVASASTLCLVQADTSKTAFENSVITFVMVDSGGNRLISAKSTVTDTDSAPFGNVIKTYSEENGTQVAQIRYVDGNPSKIVVNEGSSELPLKFNAAQTTAQGAACYDVGKK